MVVFGPLRAKALAQFIPPSFNTPEAKDDFLEWVAALPIDPQDAKQLMLNWAAVTGVSLTAQEIREAAPGLEQDEGSTP